MIFNGMNAEEENECVTFCEQIRFSIDQDQMFQNAEVKIEITNNTMSLILLSEHAFNFEEVDYIVKLIDENELFCFEKLLNLGWCSASKVVNSAPGHIEFSWLKVNSTPCICQICSDRFNKNE